MPSSCSDLVLPVLPPQEWKEIFLALLMWLNEHSLDHWDLHFAVSFYSWDRKFFLVDRESGIYATSAYYFAHMTAGELWQGCFVIATSLLLLFKPGIHEMAFPRSDGISTCHSSMAACITGLLYADAYCRRLHPQLS